LLELFISIPGNSNQHSYTEGFRFDSPHII
jgi:hypothetical protein